MYGNILLSGGTTMFAGFADKMIVEITKLAPAGTVVNVVRPPNRKYSAWIGAAQFSNEPLVKLLDKLVTRDEYLEQGFKICETRFTSV
jgi:actin